MCNAQCVCLHFIYVIVHRVQIIHLIAMCSFIHITKPRFEAMNSRHTHLFKITVKTHRAMEKSIVCVFVYQNGTVKFVIVAKTHHYLCDDTLMPVCSYHDVNSH